MSSPYDEGSAELEDGDRASLYTDRPVEAVDLAVEEAAVRDELVENLLAEVPSLEEQQREALSPGMRRKLEALGYVE